jgi:cytochrome P450
MLQPDPAWKISMTLPASFRYDPERRHLQLDPLDGTFFQDPYPAYAHLHASTSGFFWENYGFWCLIAYDAVNRLLRDRRFGREKRHTDADSQGKAGDRAHLKDFDRVEKFSMLELEPPVHTRLRILVNRAFVSRQVERLRPRIEELANDLIDRFKPRREANLIAEFATPIPVTVIAEMLGVPVETAPQLLDWSHRFVAMYMHGRTRQSEESANSAAAEFSGFLRDNAGKRRAEPAEDLLSLLLAAEADGAKLTEDELVTTATMRKLISAMVSASSPAIKSGLCLARPIAIRAPLPRHRHLGQIARTRKTSPSAPAFTFALGRRWRVSNCR